MSSTAPQQENQAPRAPRKWTCEEDKKLLRELELQSNAGTPSNWKRVAAKIPGRTNKDCRKRWNKIRTCINKGPWDKSEDERLREAIRKHGLRWIDVSREVGSRNSDQCAKRWHYAIDPSVDRSLWRPEEDSLLVAAVAQLGQAWSAISEQFFPKRATTDIKNRYVIITRHTRKARAESSKIRQDSPYSGVNSDPELENDQDDSLLSSELSTPSSLSSAPTPETYDILQENGNAWMVGTDFGRPQFASLGNLDWSDPQLYGWCDSGMSMDVNCHMYSTPDKALPGWNASGYPHVYSPLQGSSLDEPSSSSLLSDKFMETPSIPKIEQPETQTRIEAAQETGRGTDPVQRSQIKIVLDSVDPSSLSALVNVLLESNVTFWMEGAS